MLPKILTEKLCYLNENTKRMTFSIFFYIKENGEVISNSFDKNENNEPLFIKSIIKSKINLSTEFIDLICEGKIEKEIDFDGKLNKTGFYYLFSF